MDKFKKCLRGIDHLVYLEGQPFRPLLQRDNTGETRKFLNDSTTQWILNVFLQFFKFFALLPIYPSKVDVR